MHARITTPLQRLRPSPGPRPVRRSHTRSERPEPASEGDEPLFPEARVREAGGPEDRASYACGCGFVFQAEVSTSVACPHCGCAQAW